MFVGMVIMCGSVVARPAQVAANPQVEEGVLEPMRMPDPLSFAANNVCYQPVMGVFVVIDSVDCAVDVLYRHEASMVCIGRFTTDTYKGRHDLRNIIRPVSVAIKGNTAIVLASAKSDTSYLAVLDLEEALVGFKGQMQDLSPIAQLAFASSAYAFSLSDEEHEVIVVGKNSVGYDIHTVSTANGIANITPFATYHYHVPKQAERIKESDPIGGGLAIVAILVVFFALVCICFIMKWYGAAIRKVQDRKSNGTVATNNTSDVYAAIAAAIYCYEQEQHDAEDSIITIQKVERAWTPWNAKFYNMNQFFANRK